MVNIEPNCVSCMFLEQVNVQSNCGAFVYFKCINKFIRIYGEPKKIVCDEWEEERLPDATGKEGNND